MAACVSPRLVDVGPAADDARAAAKFRAFWGDASELRRFQDGKISEAVVWHAPQGGRHAIPDRQVSVCLLSEIEGEGGSKQGRVLVACLWHAPSHGLALLTLRVPHLCSPQVTCAPRKSVPAAAA